MQGTVEAFDAGSRSGSVLLDDGTRMRFGPEEFDPSGLRLLRSGQRVRLDIADSDGVPRITFITIITLARP
jgi:cold shock CspA family protein